MTNNKTTIGTEEELKELRETARIIPIDERNIS